jgi:23S rRNA pseudouridine1911/1915/1917 synthase
VAKPAGLDVFSQRRGRSESLWSWLREKHPDLERVGDPDAPAIAHRLDRPTSGILLVARDDVTYERLREGFQTGKILKDYLALVEGAVDGPFEVDLPLGGRHRRSRKVTVAVFGRRLRGVQPAQTRVRPLGVAEGKSLCMVRIHTGVRHQIRAHLGHAGHPVVGDYLYGTGSEVGELEDRLFLHAWRIHAQPPVVPNELELTCPLPVELCNVVEGLGLTQALDHETRPCYGSQGHRPGRRGTST